MTNPANLALLCDPEYMAKFHQRTRPGKWGCIEWAGGRNRGYGVAVLNGQTLPAHRVAWMIHHQAEIPPDLVIDHMCCNKGCVNPDHLEAVSDVENFRRVKEPAPGFVPIGGRWGTRRKRKGARCYPKAS